MGQTLTTYGYMIDNLDDAQEKAENWYTTTTKPFIKDHREMVMKAALGEAEEKYGALLETCDLGSACRETIMTELKATIEKIWERVFTTFEKDLKETVITTKKITRDSWDDLVECGEKANCC